MIKLKCEVEAPQRPRPGSGRRPRMVLFFIFLVVLAVSVEHWRGQLALSHWKSQLIAKGEVRDPKLFWPAPSADSQDFSTRWGNAIDQLPSGFRRLAGQPSGIVQAAPGTFRRGSQDPKPKLEFGVDAPNSWDEFGRSFQQAQPALRSLRDLMRNPPPRPSYDVARTLEDASIPNLVNVRVGAQALHAAAMFDLHAQDLGAAAEDLAALSAFAQLFEQDPNLVSFMIRVAVLGLSTDAYWDALQAGGWSEEQLALLQRASQCPKTLSQMPRAMESEVVRRLYDLEWLRSHSYEQWIDRYEPIYRSFGMKVPAREAPGVARFWRQWAFHPIWRLAWADQEELHYARTMEKDLAILKDATQRKSWISLSQQLGVTHREYRPPAASWRFYGRLPLVDSFSEIAGGSAIPAPRYPYPDFSRAWLTVLKNLTLNQMVTAAIALKRHHLRHGRLPETLAALTPEFLPETPVDFMDGKPLRYHLNTDGSFTLYSAGEDGVDDGGDARILVLKKGVERAGPWDGSDWIWPQVAALQR